MRTYLKTLPRHLWNLCEETVPLALFGSASADQKKALVKAIMKKAKTDPAPIGKAQVPKDRSDNDDYFPDLVGK